jgi:hypothetical protein
MTSDDTATALITDPTGGLYAPDLRDDRRADCDLRLDAVPASVPCTPADDWPVWLVVRGRAGTVRVGSASRLRASCGELRSMLVSSARRCPRVTVPWVHRRGLSGLAPRSFPPKAGYVETVRGSYADPFGVGCEESMGELAGLAGRASSAALQTTLHGRGCLLAGHRAAEWTVRVRVARLSAGCAE